MAFPVIYVHGTLIHTPVVGELEDSIAQDPTIRNNFDGGYIRTRAKFTRIVRTWKIIYEGLSKANKNTLEAYENTQLAGSNSFSWTNPEDGVAYAVRYVGLARYIPWPNTNFLRWNAEFLLEQV